MRPSLFAPDQPADDSPAGEARGEDAGDCRPPRSTRFLKGHSGNPGGRPKRKHKLAALVARAFDETVDAKEKGKLLSITKLEAALKQLVNRAASGDQRALQFALSLLGQDREEPKPQAPKLLGKDDSLVVAEIIRRFSGPQDDEAE